MGSKLIRKVARGQKYRILCELKRHGASSVPDLLKKIRLSYMGIKQHCIELERDGYLIKKKKPKTSGRGRPEEMYDLSAAASEWFPCHDTPLTRSIMTGLKKLYGTNAPEKILFTIYQDISQDYRKAIHSMLLEERVQEFLRLREENGYLVDFETQSTGWTISECHSPIADLLKEFPILLKFELQVYQKAIHPMMYQMHISVDPYRVVYGLGKEAI
jgi:predicted ArsR family transcriptional regulator